MKIKKTITGAIVTVLGLGGIAAPESIEMSKEYSVDQIEVEQTKKGYGNKRSEIMSKVFIAKENLITGKRKFKRGNWTITMLEKTTVMKGNDEVLKIVVNAEKDGKDYNFEPFWYVNPPVSNKTCKDKNKDEKITRDECVYDYDTESVLKQIIWESMVSQNKNVK